MKKRIYIYPLALILFLSFTSCAGDSTAKIVVNLGQRGAYQPGLIDRIVAYLTLAKPAYAGSSIPENINQITISVTAPDMITVTQTMDVNYTQPSPSITLDVSSGGNRRVTATGKHDYGPGESENRLYGGIASGLTLLPGEVKDVYIEMGPLPLNAPGELSVEYMTGDVANYFYITFSYSGNDSASITGYAIYRVATDDQAAAPEPSQYKLIGTVEGSSTTSYYDYALTGYACHYYIIAPLNQYGEGNWSDPVVGYPVN